MKKDLRDIVIQIELHSVEGIKRNFLEGISPNAIFRNEPLIFELTSEYPRGPRFKECVQVFVDFGLEFEDKTLLAILLDDAKSLEQIIKVSPEILESRYSLRCTYTPLIDVSLLHICAEYNHYLCAEIIIKYGGDVNAKAGIDENGFGAQTPIFHTVNQTSNQSAEMMNLLLSNSADLSITVKGLIWGKGYDWETLIPSVNPISYAMMGLLPQMHRKEATISQVVSILLKHQYDIDYEADNIPNKYLNP